MAEFYLHHRKSVDIDLFTEKEEIDFKATDAFLKRISSKLKIKKFDRSQFLGLVSYKLIYEDKNELKVDFNYYPFPPINKRVNFKGLKIDSVEDIAANKIHTLFMKPRGRDYVDLYCILQKYDFSLRKLVLDVKAKFDWDIDKITLASQFLKVKDFSPDYQMVIPFNPKNMEAFYFKLAKSLEEDIFIK